MRVAIIPLDVTITLATFHPKDTRSPVGGMICGLSGPPRLT